MVDVAPGALAVIVVNYGSSALLAENLAPLSRALVGATIVVVDNRTTAEERARVAALAEAEGWMLEAPTSNTGFGAGVNLGAARAIRAGAEWLLVLNPDAWIEAATVEQLVARASRSSLVCPRIVRPDGSTWFDGADLHLADGRLRNRKHRPTTEWEPWVTGACFVVSTELWQRVDGFDPDYFLYWEDVDLCHRILEAGGSVEVHDDLEATHAEGGTQGEGHAAAGLRKSDTYYYFSIRNRLVFAAKHLDARRLEAWSSNAREVALEVLLQGGRRQFLRSLRPLFVARRALRDGRSLAREIAANKSVA